MRRGGTSDGDGEKEAAPRHGEEESAPRGCCATAGREELRHREADLVGDELDLVGDDQVAAVAAAASS